MKFPRPIASSYNRIEKDASIVGRLFDILIEQIANAFYGISADYLVRYVIKKDVNRLFTDFHSSINTLIVNGIKREWQAANDNTDILVKKILGSDAEKKYLRPNDNALDDFLNRKQAGLNLSQRVWNLVKDTQNTIADVLKDGIKDGDSANDLSKLLKTNVLQKDGIANPGQGVYADPRKNAKRLARTEINMAYKSADYERWQQLDFVIGIEVHLSNNPHHCPVCESLQGKYPKDFKFVSWHPQCRCFAVPIMDHEDGAERVEAPNENFINWIDGNIDRVKKYKSVPYFIKDNKKYINVN